MGDAKYRNIAPERFEMLQRRYIKFIERVNNVDMEPVRVFDPLSQKCLDDICLIREVSADLQIKKNEEMKRLAQAAKEAEEQAKEAAKQQQAEEKGETDEPLK